MLITIEELRRWFDEDSAGLVTRLQEETGRYGSEEAESWRKSLQTLREFFERPPFSHFTFTSSGAVIWLWNINFRQLLLGLTSSCLESMTNQQSQ